MVELLRNLKQLSLGMMQKLDQATMEDFLEFIQKREEVIEKLKQEKVKQTEMTALALLAEEISQYDLPIIARMNELKQEASYGLAKFDRSRMQRRAYESHYTWESAFIDTKK